MIRSYIDDRSYRRVVLDNGMKCMIVSDSQCKLSSVCVLNPRGSLYDPIDHQGMTHFLEHMLFLGSKKYPEEKYYRKFISDNGGRCNAWTYLNFTYYHFDVIHSEYEKGLDILSNQLDDPILDVEAGMREVWAVNSEHYVNSSNNVSRYHTLFRDISAGAYSKYLMGNLHTLNIVDDRYKDMDMCDMNRHIDDSVNNKQYVIDKDKFKSLMMKMRVHHEGTFSSDNMYAVLIDNRSLDDIQHIASRTLGKMRKRKGVDKRIFKNEGQPIKEYGKLIRFKPLNTWNFMSVFFFLDPIWHKLTKPIKFIKYMIGHSRGSSLSSYMKQQGYIHDIYTYNEHVVDYFSYIEIRIMLTDKGIDNSDRIMKMVGGYMYWLKTKMMMREDDMMRLYRDWVYEKRVIAYYTSGDEEGLEYCTQLSKNMYMNGYDNREVLLSHKSCIYSTPSSSDVYTDTYGIDIDEGYRDVIDSMKMMDGSRCIVYISNRNTVYSGTVYSQYIHNIQYTIDDIQDRLVGIFAYGWYDMIDMDRYMNRHNKEDDIDDSHNNKSVSFTVDMNEGGGNIVSEIREYINDGYTDVYNNIVPYVYSYTLPDVCMSKNIHKYTSYSVKTTYTSDTHMKMIYNTSNMKVYYNRCNVMNRYSNSIKMYIYLPCMSMSIYKNVEYYCINLYKTMRKEVIYMHDDICGIDIQPTTTGIYINIYSKLSKMALDMISDVCRCMTMMLNDKFKVHVNSDSIRDNYSKMNVVDMSHHQLMCVLGLYVDVWQTDIYSNILNIKDISKQILYSKTIIMYMGRFDIDDCITKSKYYYNNYCYQKDDYYTPPLNRYCILPKNSKYILRKDVDDNNSCMLYFFQTIVDDFYDYYAISNKNDKYTMYDISKIYTLLAHHILQSDYYQSLRSIQLVGYDVYSRVIMKEGMLGIGYFIQSNDISPDILSSMTYEYIVNYINSMNITQSDVDRYIDILQTKPIDRIYQYDDVLHKMNEIFYSNVSFKDYIVYPNIYSDIRIDVDDLMKFIKKIYIEYKNSIQIHIISNNHRDMYQTIDNTYIISSHISYRLRMSSNISISIFDRCMI